MSDREKQQSDRLRVLALGDSTDEEPGESPFTSSASVSSRSRSGSHSSSPKPSSHRCERSSSTAQESAGRVKKARPKSMHTTRLSLHNKSSNKSPSRSQKSAKHGSSGNLSKYTKEKKVSSVKIERRAPRTTRPSSSLSIAISTGPEPQTARAHSRMLSSRKTMDLNEAQATHQQPQTTRTYYSQAMLNAVRIKKADSGFDGYFDDGRQDVLTPRSQKLRWMRHHTILEVVDSERAYVTDLEVLAMVFRRPLEEQGLMSPKELSQVFTNFPLVLETNREFLSQLEHAVNEAKEQEALCASLNSNYFDDDEEDDILGKRMLIGPMFTQLAASLKTYSLYCNNHQRALDTVEECQQKNPEFAAFLEQQLANPACKGLSFTSYLIKPIQRVCKYPLLLRELLLHTKPTHADYSALVAADEAISKAVDEINEAKRSSENVAKIIRIKNLIDASKKGQLQLLAPTRRFLFESSFRDLVSSSKTEPSMWYMFSDMILCLRPKKGKVIKPNSCRVRAWIPLHLASAQPLSADDVAFRKLKTTSEFALQILHLGVMKYVVFANDEAERVKWLSIIGDDAAQLPGTK